MCIAGTAEAVRGLGHDHGHTHAAASHDHHAPSEAGGMSRRAVIGAGLAAAIAAALPAGSAEAAGKPAVPPGLAKRAANGSRVADLTQVFAESAPTYTPEKAVREVFSPPAPPGQFGFYNQRWTFNEHIGTHVDAPGHVIGGGRLTPQIDPTDLIAPAVVVDIRAKARQNPNAMVEVADLRAFERRHGRIPRRAAVLMDSGWAARWSAGDLAYRGTQTLDQFPFNFPGFSAAAVEWLVEQRNIVGVGVDTLSTDPGNSTDFRAHEVLGRSDRWGIENLTGLDRMPARGGTLVLGLVPWEAGSGGPCRALAFW